MSDDLWQVLTRFHRDVIQPDIERVVDVKVDRLRDEMLKQFDAIHARFDRFESMARVAQLQVHIEQLEATLQHRLLPNC